MHPIILQTLSLIALNPHFWILSGEKKTDKAVLWQGLWQRPFVTRLWKTNYNAGGVPDNGFSLA